VDNTFASPYLQSPLELGATLSLVNDEVHQWHSDCLGGVVASNDAGWQEKMIFAQKALGLTPSPFDAWLTTRGSARWSLRWERHCSNALELACWLEKQPGVRLVPTPSCAVILNTSWPNAR
jgi:cystathionine gamma-synthase